MEIEGLDLSQAVCFVDCGGEEGEALCYVV